MIRILGRVVLSVLMVFQVVQPALASGRVMVEDCGGCAVACTACEPVECVSCDACAIQAADETASTVIEECGCGSAQVSDEAASTEESVEPQPSDPQPAATQKPETFAPARPTEAAPSTETPAPELDTTEETLPPAPIAVPLSESAQPAPSTEQVLPGPAAEDSPPAEQPRRISTEGLFDEPAPPAESTPSETTPGATTDEATTEEPAPEPTGTEGLFDEPMPPAEEEEGSTESAPEEEAGDATDETQEAEPAADPLEGLFGPATPTTEPEEEPAPESQPESPPETEESENLDPFGQMLPALKSAGGLASREFRLWSNRAATATYEARLVRFSAEGVLLARRSGGMVVLSFAQLSDADLAFAREQVRAQRSVLAQAATLKVASSIGH